MTVLRRYRVGVILGLLSLVLPSFSAAQDVPSGQPITLNEVLVDSVDGESWLRFRFVAPRIGRGATDISYADAAADMEFLCGDLVIPYLTEYELESDLVVISLADQPIEFGETNPDVTQYFDAFRVKNDACIWEVF